MLTQDGIRIIASLCYKPGWKFTATDATDRFATGIRLRIDYPAQNYNREEAPAYATEIMASASFLIQAGTCDCDTTLIRRVLDCIARIDQHEAREALRVHGTYDAPFHPHTVEGIALWGDPVNDITFGLA